MGQTNAQAYARLLTELDVEGKGDYVSARIMPNG